MCKGTRYHDLTPKQTIVIPCKLHISRFNIFKIKASLKFLASPNPWHLSLRWLAPRFTVSQRTDMTQLILCLTTLNWGDHYIVNKMELLSLKGFRTLGPVQGCSRKTLVNVLSAYIYFETIPRLALNLLFSWEWPWTPNPPVVCAAMLGYFSFLGLRSMIHKRTL